MPPHQQLAEGTAAGLLPIRVDTSVKRDLHKCQKRPTCMRHKCQKRPTQVSKETYGYETQVSKENYTSVNRDLRVSGLLQILKIQCPTIFAIQSRYTKDF